MPALYKNGINYTGNEMPKAEYVQFNDDISHINKDNVQDAIDETIVLINENKNNISALSDDLDALSDDIADEIDNINTNKADKNTTYTKTEVDDLIPNISGKLDNDGNADNLVISSYTDKDIDGTGQTQSVTYENIILKTLFSKISDIIFDLRKGLRTKLDSSSSITNTTVTYTEKNISGQFIEENIVTKTIKDIVERLQDKILGNTTEIKNKADKTTTYTKDETDEVIRQKTWDMATQTQLVGIENEVAEQIGAVNTSLNEYEQKGYLSRNLVKFDNSLYKGITAQITSTVDSDGVISFNGTASANSFVYNDLSLLNKGVRKVSYNSTNKLHYVVIYTDDTSSGYIDGNVEFEIPSNKQAKATRFYIEKDAVSNSIVAKPMFVSHGSTEFTPVIQTNLNALNSNITDLQMLGWEVPEECPIKNSVSGNQFIQRVGRVDMGTINYMNIASLAASGTFPFELPNMNYNADGVNAYCSNYKVKKSLSWDLGNNEIVTVKGQQGLRIKDTSCTSSDAIKTKTKGIYIYYELATPITKTIDGNEAVSALNESLTTYGMTDVFNGLSNGWYAYNTGTFNNTNRGVTTGIYPCAKVAKTIIKEFAQDMNIYVLFYNGSTYVSGSAFDRATEVTVNIPSGANGARFCFITTSGSGSVTTQTAGKVSVYVDNAIDTLKSDLYTQRKNISFVNNWVSNGIQLFRIGNVAMMCGSIRYGTDVNVGNISDASFRPVSAQLGTIVNYSGTYNTYVLVDTNGNITLGKAPTSSSDSYIVNIMYVTNYQG